MWLAHMRQIRPNNPMPYGHLRLYAPLRGLGTPPTLLVFYLAAVEARTIDPLTNLTGHNLARHQLNIDPISKNTFTPSHYLRSASSW